MRRLKVVIRGAGEHASATAHRLFRCGMRVALTEVQQPTAIRRAVAFCSAIFEGTWTVEGVPARLWSLDNWRDLEGAALDHLPVFVDPEGLLIERWRPDVVVDARILKRNEGNSLNQAPLVIGLGPGLLAGQDVHVVIETQRGHDLGRVIHSGYTSPDTGVPGVIAGQSADRVLRAPCAGIVENAMDIGQRVAAGDTVCTVGGQPVLASISGVLRGMIHPGIEVTDRLKISDVDPRGDPAYCTTISDKARTLSGSVLEAILTRFPPGWP
ncbi:MAG: EF2563 family selenium-dependent molybdenum hydroxylase system protein [Bradymonadales bacterium]|nr:EF2563 family selenium-dependent molybdenum hydroxylase system protein [Bradymonadales bacterium]